MGQSIGCDIFGVATSGLPDERSNSTIRVKLGLMQTCLLKRRGPGSTILSRKLLDDSAIIPNIGDHVNLPESSFSGDYRVGDRVFSFDGGTTIISLILDEATVML